MPVYTMIDSKVAAQVFVDFGEPIMAFVLRGDANQSMSAGIGL